jgi:hypothetical protein
MSAASIAQAFAQQFQMLAKKLEEHEQVTAELREQVTAELREQVFSLARRIASLEQENALLRSAAKADPAEDLPPSEESVPSPSAPEISDPSTPDPRPHTQAKSRTRSRVRSGPKIQGKKDMRLYLVDGQRIKHTKKRDTWYGRFDYENNQIVCDNGRTFNTPSGMAKAHFAELFPSRSTKGNSGTQQCRAETKEGWVKLKDLPDFPI